MTKKEKEEDPDICDNYDGVLVAGECVDPACEESPYYEFEEELEDIPDAQLDAQADRVAEHEEKPTQDKNG